MDEHIKLLIRSLGEDRIKLDIDLSDQMQTRLAGPAQAFYIATTKRELTKAIELCRELKVNFLVFGSGSKMALSEKGIKGLVIKNRCDNLNIFGIKGKVSRTGIGIEEAFLEAESGVSLTKLADFAKSQGLGGMEGLENSLGTLGGSLRVLHAARENIHQVKVLSKAGSEKTKVISEIGRDDIILSVVFKLKAKKG